MVEKNDELFDEAKIGLSWLFKGLNYWSVFEDQLKDRTHFEKHPFGLDIDNKSRFHMGIHLLNDPGYTDRSVDAMINHIRLGIAGNPTETARPLRLRKIFASTESAGKHNVYFEVANLLGIFICGGCTDYSGAGQEGKQMLDGVFSLLNLFYDVPIEKVTIPFPKSKQMEEGIRRYLYEIFLEKKKGKDREE